MHLTLLPINKVVILLSGGLREEVKVLDLEPALYYLQGLLDNYQVTGLEACQCRKARMQRNHSRLRLSGLGAA